MMQRQYSGKKDTGARDRTIELERDIAAQADALEGIRQGLEDVRLGHTRPAREFFAEFEARHGLRAFPDLRSETWGTQRPDEIKQ
jgi:hypothetical protein